MKPINSIKASLSFLFLFIFCGASVACTCQSIDIFCGVVSENQSIVQVEVLDNDFNNDYKYMHVKILENIHNNIDEDTAVIIGNNGANCGENIDMFEPKDTLILALHEYGSDLDSIASWFLSGCGKHFLIYKNGQVLGSITESVDSQPYQEFKSQIQDCFNYRVSVEHPDAYNHIYIFPNPVREKLRFSSNQLRPTNIKITSLNGEVIYEEKEFDMQSELSLMQLQRGIYFVHLLSAKGIVTSRKFIKL